MRCLLIKTLSFSLSAHQLSGLDNIKFQNVYHTLHVFVQWIEDGYYDFQALPYATKMHLQRVDGEILQQLQQIYTGKPNCTSNYGMQKYKL